MLKKQIIPIVRAFQSALPRGERQQIGGSLDEDRNISIHAPARGATVSLVTRDSAHKHFNPRSREGSDTFGERSNGSSSIISIRAPARGATWVHHSQRQSAPYFNPRSHEGSDGICPVCNTPVLEFQSALPRGERP